MKTLFIATILISSFSVQAQVGDLFENEVKTTIGNLEYADGLDINYNSKKNNSKDLVWDVSTNGNTKIYSKNIKNQDKDTEVDVTFEVTYDDLDKKSPKIKQMHQVVKDKKDGKAITYKVFTVSTHKNKDKRISDASECVTVDANLAANLRTYKCVAVNDRLCSKLTYSLNQSKLDVKELESCANSLKSIQDVLSDQSYMPEVKKSSSYKKTMGIFPNAKSVDSINGNIFGTENAKSGSATLKDVFSMVDLCKRVGMDDEKYSGPKPEKVKEEQNQEAEKE